LPRYRFQWGNLPRRLLLLLCRDLLDGYDEADLAASLRSVYGARPDEEFVREAWSTLLTAWLETTKASRERIVQALRDVPGEDGALGGRDKQMAYLRGLRNAKRPGAVVLSEFVTFGETEAEVTTQTAGRTRPATNVPTRRRSGTGGPYESDAANGGTDSPKEPSTPTATTRTPHMPAQIDNPILNGPYDQPDRYYEIGPQGPTGEIRDGRRPSESFIPVAATKKGKGQGVQQEIDFDLTGKRREKNSLINDLRREVEKWRRGGHYDGVTAITRKLLQHWADPTRENRVLFCQREAAETAIFLTEVAGRNGVTDWRKRLEPENEAHNSGLPRVALKMATGSGKTIVMAMLIAWQTLNKVQSPRDARFTNKFLIVTPGITIRDRLRVLLPEDPENYYELRDLIPSDLKGGLERARIAITNYHTFQLVARSIRTLPAAESVPVETSGRPRRLPRHSSERRRRHGSLPRRGRRRNQAVLRSCHTRAKVPLDELLAGT
jgi:hypothetical protein